MYDSTATNDRFYIVKWKVETLLSGTASEKKATITLFPNKDKQQHNNNTVKHVSSNTDTEATPIINQFPTYLYSIGKLMNYAKKLYIDQVSYE